MHQREARGRRKLQASHGQRFTLIELLVIISIISILASLLLPALKNAMNSAKSINCTGNLKQVGLAALGYASDFGGLAPPVSTTATYFWAQFLIDGNYLPVNTVKLGQHTVLNCPSYEVAGTTPGAQYYGMLNDAGAVGNGSWKIEDNKVRYCFNDSFPGVPRTNLYTPSEFILIGDSARLGMGSENQWYSVSPYYASYSATCKLIHTRHSNRANALFADGHALPCIREELISNGITGFKTQIGSNQNGMFY